LIVVLTANATLVFLMTGVAAVPTSLADADVVMPTAKTALAISFNLTIFPQIISFWRALFLPASNAVDLCWLEVPSL
jgi:hypothetical protein